jgi:flagellar hook-associated protein 1 FlgK
MSLSQALATAMSGLRANQAALALVSSNVANAETPGYVKKTLNTIATTTADYGSSVRINGVNRELDQFVQTQLRTETSGAAYADIRSSFLANLQGVYGDPDSTGTLESALNALTTAVQALSTSPDSQSARIGVVNAAQTLAQQLNATSQGIQALRGSAETGLSNAVSTANNAMAQIATINNQLAGGGQTDASTAALLDQRDQYITQLSQLMDIRIHQFRRAARRRPGGETVVQRARDGDAEHVVECRSVQEQSRDDQHRFPERRQHGPGFHRIDPIRCDRRVSRTAR